MLDSYANVKVPAGKQRTREIRSEVETTLPPQQPAWRRVWQGPLLMHYHRLIALVFLANLPFFYFAFRFDGWWSGERLALAPLSYMVLANITLAIVVRQQYVINLFFRVATSAPTSWPLGIRRLLGKVYHFGGLHVGGAVVGTIWFIIFTSALFVSRARGLTTVSAGVFWSSIALVVLLLGLILMAMPQIRARYHDSFELSHRFGGWSALLLFWLQTLLFVRDQQVGLSYSTALLRAPGFWLLLLVTFSIALPWLRLKKVPVELARPSNHVTLAHFNYGVTPFAGSSTSISRSPLREWHAFANVPSPDQPGFRLTISRAGDWTGEFIDDLPSHVWVKGIPTAGVGNIDQLFKRVVWIATGSGIGPTLPHLLAKTAPAHLVWSTRSPRLTYGDELVDEILTAQPDALIWDTNERGRPDLVQLAYEAVRDYDAEAVIVIANKKLTWQVVYGMESRGIPAYGAIWDS